MKAYLRFYVYNENRLLYIPQMVDEGINVTTEFVDDRIEFYINNSKTHTMTGSGIHLDGKRVYECDFLRFPDESVYRVSYHNIFILTNIRDCSIKSFNKKTLMDATILGNKYTRPELETIFKINNDKRKNGNT